MLSNWQESWNVELALWTLIRDDTLRKCPNVSFRVLQAIYISATLCETGAYRTYRKMYLPRRACVVRTS